MTEKRSGRLHPEQGIKRTGGASSLPLLPGVSRRWEESRPSLAPLSSTSTLFPPIAKPGVPTGRLTVIESQTQLPTRFTLNSPLSSPKTSRTARRRTSSIILDKVILKQPLFVDASAAGVIRDQACVSKPGLVDDSPKAKNQDAVLMARNVDGQSDLSLFCVFDGHGTYGHDISSFLRDHIEPCLRDSLAQCPPSAPESYCDVLKSTFRLATTSLRKASVDYTYSGSTAIAVLLKGSLCLCANVGDSRAILGKKTLTEWIPVGISVDHKPTVAEEHSRIVAAGGKVAAHYCNAGAQGGPLRVWLKNQKLPGLAMTRSIGDTIAAKIGVIPDPEIHQCSLTSHEKFLIIASDGLWEVLTNEEVVSIAGRYYESYTCMRCAEGLAREAGERWRRNSLSCDDISVVVVFFG